MIPQWLFGNNMVRWESCMAHFDRHGLTLPLVPDTLERVLRNGLRSEAAGCFVTPGWRSKRPWTDLVDDWVLRPEPVRASMGLHLSGKEPVVEVSLATPFLGVFMRHRWPASPDAEPERLSVSDAHRSAAQLLWDAERLVRAGLWPSGQRLLLVDDDLDLARWGWLEAGLGATGAMASDIRVMKVSHSMYQEVMSVLDGWHHRAPEALAN